jgi:hypothetical protein
MIIAFENKNLIGYHDSIVEGLLNIGYLKDKIDKGEKVLLIYDAFNNNVGKRYDGLESIFKIDGLVVLINNYFIKNKIEMKACKDMYERNEGNIKLNVIKIEKFIRMNFISRDKEKEDIGREVIDLDDKKYKDIFKKK